tara:strand:- start:1746 stop:3488 length:1743 start_codon:yes stop_codon:yes gene_type:complete
MGFKPLLAVAFLTWKASIRYRFFWVMLGLLLLAVGGMPLIVKDDGSAAGMTQILITYTLAMITAIMGAATLWISAGSLANEIENHQLQMVATKPISRWQIWLGKWVGVMSMNFVLLLFAGGVVYGMVEYRANQLTRDGLNRIKDLTENEIRQLAYNSGIPQVESDPKTGRPKEDKEGNPILVDIGLVRNSLAGLEEKKLRDKILVARASIPMINSVGRRALYQTQTNGPLSSRGVPLETWVEQMMKEYVPKREVQLLQMKIEAQQESGVNPGEIVQELDSYEKVAATNQIRQEILGYSQILGVAEGLSLQFKKPRGWNPDELGEFAMRFYFEDTQVAYKDDDLYPFVFGFGPGKGQVVQDTVQFDARTFHEIPMPVSLPSNEGGRINMFDTNSLISIFFYNGGRASLKVPYLDSRGRVGGKGVELLYKEAGFAVNYLRALGIVFAWLGALAALGLFAGSFMSFSMSAFACIGVLVISFCLGLMQDVVEEGTVMQTYTDGQRDKSYVDTFAMPAFKVMVALIKPIKDYSPVEKLTEGRSITWFELLRAYGYIWGLSGLTMGVLGSIILSKRQLAITSTNGG